MAAAVQMSDDIHWPLFGHNVLFLECSDVIYKVEDEYGFKTSPPLFLVAAGIGIDNIIFLTAEGCLEISLTLGSLLSDMK